MTRRLAGDAARRGAAVVSGLARGVDAAEHAAAVDAGGVSWAVLGAGLAHVYPPENLPLARRLVESGGAVLSEMPLRTAPRPELFPRRNRIVAGLSWATVVVEGRRRSGSLITARLAGEYGREVLAVPGPADSPLSEAPHWLISQGAGLAASADDLWRVLPPGEGGAPPSYGGGEPLTKEEAGIVALIGSDCLSLDELVRLSGLDTARISSIIFGLEIKEAIISVPGQRYAQKAR
jgi:DNA processing protein